MQDQSSMLRLEREHPAIKALAQDLLYFEIEANVVGFSRCGRFLRLFESLGLEHACT